MCTRISKLAASPESLPNPQRAQPTSAALHSPLKELLQRFSKAEMDRLVEALGRSRNWEALAAKLQYKAQQGNRVFRKIRLIPYDNNTPEECANAFLVFLQDECPDITPAMFIDGLNQILLNTTAEMVREKMKSAAPVSTAQILKSVAPASNKSQSTIRLDMVLQKLTEHEMKRILRSISVYDKWENVLFVLAENVGHDKMNPHSIIASIKQLNKTDLARARAFIVRLQNEYPELTAEVFIKTLKVLEHNHSASELEEKIKELQQPPEPPQASHRSLLTVKKLLQRFSDDEMEKLLVDLCPRIGAFEGWWNVGYELATEVKNSQLNLTVNYYLIEGDNKTPLQRASIFLVFLQNECPEITPEMLVKALKKLSLNDTADLVQRKMQENAPQRPAPQSVPPVSPSSNGPLKEIFRQLSEDEMDTLLEALCPDAWKMLAKALAPDVLDNKLSDTRIKVLEYDNTSPVKSVLSLFRQLQEWPEITPQKFVDGLEQVVSFRVSNIVAKNWDR